MTQLSLEQIIAFAEATKNDLIDPDYKDGEWLVEAVETAETIQNFIDASKHYAECSAPKLGSVAGFNFAAFSKVQVRKGDVRRSLSVIDFGNIRLAIDADLTDYSHREFIEKK